MTDAPKQFGNVVILDGALVIMSPNVEWHNVHSEKLELTNKTHITIELIINPSKAGNE